jgi:hypothetical protein
MLRREKVSVRMTSMVCGVVGISGFGLLGWLANLSDSNSRIRALHGFTKEQD